MQFQFPYKNFLDIKTKRLPFQDFFYICKGHLTDKSFCSPIVDPQAAERAAREAREREIELVKKEYEEKQRLKREEKEKSKKKDKEDSKSDEDDDKKKKKGDEKDKIKSGESDANKVGDMRWLSRIEMQDSMDGERGKADVWLMTIMNRTRSLNQ